jgi:hypothetical protein
MDDLVAVLGAARPCPVPANCPTDVDASGTTDARDITAVLARLGTACGGASKGVRR